MKKVLLSLCLLVFTTMISAQSQLWTWMKGNNTINSYGIYGTQNTPDAANKPGTRYGGLSWTGASGELFMLGGFGYGGTGVGQLNDLWKFNTSSSMWTWVHGGTTSNIVSVYGTQGVEDPANMPGGRNSSITWTDASGNQWLFGGLGFSAASGYLNDLWKYNPINNQWAWMGGDQSPNALGVYGTMGTPDQSNKPGGRASSVSWADGNGNLWLFGGNGYSTSTTRGNMNDLWKYNIASGLWTWMGGSNSINAAGTYGTKGTAAAANKPGSRRNSISWTDGSGNLWLFGGLGSGANNNLNDLWKYNTSSGMWTWVSGSNTSNDPGEYGTKGQASATTRPQARQSSTSWKDAAGDFWLFGGDGYEAANADTLNDMWKYNIANNEWTWMSGDNVKNQPGVYGIQSSPDPANKPGARLLSMSWTDNNNRMWLFGGHGFAATVSKGYLNDLWRFAATPVITSFTPQTAGAGDTVTIIGSGFTDASAVFFGGVAASSFMVVNSTAITAVVASGATGNVVVNTPSGTTSLAGFTYCASTFSEETVTACYSYTWHDSTYKNSGDYTFDTTNAIGCDSTITLHLTITFLSSTFTKTDAGCNGTATGSLTVTPTSGTGPYTYRLGTTGAYVSGNSFNNLKAGNYRVWIKDAVECQGLSDIITIGQLSKITGTTSSTPATCFETKTGSLTVTSQTNGTPPYMYSLGTAGAYQNNNVFNNLRAATYRVNIKDGAGCIGTITAIVMQPPSISTSFTKTDVSCASTNDGTITASAANGAGGYEFKFGTAGTYQSSGSFNNLRVATYRIFVRDRNGCNGPALVVPIGKDACNLRATLTKKEAVYPLSGITLFPNPSSGTFNLRVNSENDKQLQLRVSDVNGKVIHVAKGSALQTYTFGEKFVSGMYLVEVIQGNERRTLKAVRIK